MVEWAVKAAFGIIHEINEREGGRESLKIFMNLHYEMNVDITGGRYAMLTRLLILFVLK